MIAISRVALSRDRRRKKGRERKTLHDTSHHTASLDVVSKGLFLDCCADAGGGFASRPNLRAMSLSVLCGLMPLLVSTLSRRQAGGADHAVTPAGPAARAAFARRCAARAAFACGPTAWSSAVFAMCKWQTLQGKSMFTGREHCAPLLVRWRHWPRHFAVPIFCNMPFFDILKVRRLL